MREMPAAGKKEKKRALGVSLSEILQTCNTILLNTLLSGEQDGLHLDFEHVRDLIGEWISARAATASYDYAAAGCPPRRFSVGQENHDGQRGRRLCRTSAKTNELCNFGRHVRERLVWRLAQCHDFAHGLGQGIVRFHAVLAGE